MLGVWVGVRSRFGEKVAVRSWFLGPGGIWSEDRGKAREDSLILLSPATLSSLLGGVTMVARLPPFCGVLTEGGVQICCERGSEEVGVGVGRMAAPGTFVTSNHPLITPSLMTLASSIVCSWILLRASPNSSTTFAALITSPSTTVERSAPEIGERRVGGGIEAWSTSRPTPARIMRIPRTFSSNSSLSRRVLMDTGSFDRDL